MKLIKSLVLLGVSGLFALVLGEMVLRALGPKQTKFYIWPPKTENTFKPDSALMPGVSGEARFLVNSLGARGPEVGDDAKEYRILAVGGSTTECVYLDQDRAWPALVDAGLERTVDGRDVWVGNVGKAGMNSRDHVLHVQYVPPQLPRIDTILLLVGINDLTVALAKGDKYVSEPPLSNSEAERRQIRRAFTVAPGALHEAPTEAQSGAEDVFWKKTAIVQLLRRIRDARTKDLSERGLAQDAIGQRFKIWREYRQQTPKLVDRLPDMTQALADYRGNLNRIADLAAAQKVRLVLMTQPTIWRDDLPEAAKALLWLGGVGEFQRAAGSAYYAVGPLAVAMQRYNEVLLDVCKQRQLPCLDLAPAIPKDTTMFYDDTHFTEAGARAVATAIVQHLRQLVPFSR